MKLHEIQIAELSNLTRRGGPEVDNSSTYLWLKKSEHPFVEFAEVSESQRLDNYPNLLEDYTGIIPGIIPGTRIASCFPPAA